MKKFLKSLRALKSVLAVTPLQNKILNWVLLLIAVKALFWLFSIGVVPSSLPDSVFDPSKGLEAVESWDNRKILIDEATRGLSKILKIIGITSCILLGLSWLMSGRPSKGLLFASVGGFLIALFANGLVYLIIDAST